MVGYFILIIHLDKYIRTVKIMAVFQPALLHPGCELALLIDGRRSPAAKLLAGSLGLFSASTNINLPTDRSEDVVLF